MAYRYVVIEREYGSGGTGIGRRLAAEMGWECYGREILEMASQEMHIPVEQMEHLEESATNSLLYSLSIMAKVQHGEMPEVSKADKLKYVEHKLIRRIADEKPAVFVGRCAGAALYDRKDVLKVFIHGEIEDRRKRAVQEYGILEHKAADVLRQMDRRRGSFYTANTGFKWKDLSHYHLTLDSSGLGIENCVRTIKSLL
ncbi:MAG: AAA family ATPase [Blautia sp.]